MSALVVRGLAARRGARPVLRGVDLDVPAGRVLAVFGPSGAGKSTLLGAIAGELPSTGEVLVGGRDVSREPMFRRARAGLGYVPQGPSVLFDLSARDNLRSFARLAGLSVDPDAALAEVALASRADVRAGELSGGERRRLELARALLLRPRALLCDEPFTGLSPPDVTRLGALLRDRSRAADVALVLTDHHVEAALAIADLACLLVDGALLLTCEARDFAAHPAVTDRYLAGLPTR